MLTTDQYQYAFEFEKLFLTVCDVLVDRSYIIQTRIAIYG